MPILSLVRRLRTRAFALRSAVLLGTLASGASANEGGRDTAGAAYLARSWSVAAPRFWWPAVVFERGSSHLTGERSVDETRFGLMLAYRTSSLSPHLRALISPSLGAYQNLAGTAGAGVRVHFELGGVALSYGIGMSIEARLRDSLWLAYATPIELGTALYRGDSAEHHLFVGARRSMAGSLINSYLLDPNGYDNEDSLDRLHDLRDAQAWQLYVSLVFGRRVE
jgi:hypothetical protein